MKYISRSNSNLLSIFFCLPTVNYSHALRHFVLPGGELLIANIEHRDIRHRYRCHVRHEITLQTFYSSTWAHIKLKGKFF